MKQYRVIRCVAFFAMIYAVTGAGAAIRITIDTASAGRTFEGLGAASAGASSRLLIDYHLQRLKITPAGISGYDVEVYTHFDVGLSILSGEADVGIATAVVSKLLGLQFIPITWESFDMVLDQPTFFEKGLQTFIDVLKSKEFRKIVDKLGGYDFKDSGKILYSAV